MAIYPYRCRLCEEYDEVWQSISSYSESPRVPQHCGLPMTRVITKPLVSFDVAPWGAYQSPIDGTMIDSRAKQREHMAKHDVVLYDDIAPDIARNRERIQKEARAGILESVIEATNRVEAGYKPQVESIDKIVPEASNG